MQQYSDTIQDRSGNVISGATITVTNYPSGTTAVTYATDAVGATTNPLTSDSNGQYSFYAANGSYTLTITKTGLTTTTKVITLKQTSQILAASTTSVSCPADTTEDILATITVPGGWMGANGILRATLTWTSSLEATAKTVRVRFGGIGGSAYYAGSLTSATIGGANAIVVWQNVTTGTQTGFISGSTSGTGTINGGIAPTTGSVDTTADTTIVITGQKATAGNTLTLNSYFVELLTP